MAQRRLCGHSSQANGADDPKDPSVPVHLGDRPERGTPEVEKLFLIGMVSGGGTEKESCREQLQQLLTNQLFIRGNLCG